MSLAGSLHTVTSAEATTIVPPSVDSQKVLVRNTMPDGDLNQHVRDGYSYSIHTDISVAQSAQSYFSFTTGDFGAQIQGYRISIDASNVEANLYEGATITKTGSALQGYNLNRAYSDAHEADLYGASALTGGTAVFSESVYASNQSSGNFESRKIISLEPNTEYGFKFDNIGSQTARIHFEMIWTERFNGHTTVWLNGAVGEGFPLKGNEQIEMQLFQGESMTAISGGADCAVTVLRQD